MTTCTRNGLKCLASGVQLLRICLPNKNTSDDTIHHDLKYLGEYLLQDGGFSRKPDTCLAVPLERRANETIDLLVTRAIDWKLTGNVSWFNTVNWSLIKIDTEIDNNSWVPWLPVHAAAPHRPHIPWFLAKTIWLTDKKDLPSIANIILVDLSKETITLWRWSFQF